MCVFFQKGAANGVGSMEEWYVSPVRSHLDRARTISGRQSDQTKALDEEQMRARSRAFVRHPRD